MLHFFICACLLVNADPTEPVADTVVVCPPKFIPALEPWLAYRHSQGHRFVHIGRWESQAGIQRDIARLAAQGGLKHVVLVGDATGNEQARREQLLVPTSLIESKVVRQFSNEPDLASDVSYGDLNGDAIPELTVGRLPADSPEDLSMMVRKIIAYEKLADYGPWRQKVNIIAGVGGFGGLIDGVVEMSTRQFLTKGIPASYASSMTYGNWRSPYCPDPRYFKAVTQQRLEEGCLFWVYIGHGRQRELDRVSVPGADLPILSAEDAAGLKLRPHWPVAIFLACHTGAFDQPRDCLAEELLRAEGGPVAVFAGSRVTMPYAMAVMGTELLDVVFQEHPATLGEAILLAKQRMSVPPKAGDADKLGNREILDALASALSPNSEELLAELREHVVQFNLLGDPLLRIPHPLPVEMKIEGETKPGSTLRLVGSSDVVGRCTLELVARRDTLRFDAPARKDFLPTEDGLRGMQATYQQANDSCWNRLSFVHQGGTFEQELNIPEECRGFCHVRAVIEGKDSHAAGAADLYVRPPVRQQR